MTHDSVSEEQLKPIEKQDMATIEFFLDDFNLSALDRVEIAGEMYRRKQQSAENAARAVLEAVDKEVDRMTPENVAIYPYEQIRKKARAAAAPFLNGK